MIDELGRVGGGILGQAGINSMALPPLMTYGSQYLKDKVCRDVVMGKKHICLAISEPHAGSDVAGVQCSHNVIKEFCTSVQYLSVQLTL